MFDRLRQTISKRFSSDQPPLFYAEESLAFWRERDPPENAETTPPTDEFIDLNCLWAVEFYTPDHRASLVEGFRRLGWEHEDAEDQNYRDPIAWLDGLNRHSQGDGWLNLGALVPEESPERFVGYTHRVQLPPGVSYALGRIQNLSPSLICLVICFVFDEQYSPMFDKALREERKTYTTPTRKGHRIHRPRNQKHDHISQIRTQISRSAGTWFRDKIPGEFASGLLDSELPTCELTTLRNAEPFPSIEEQSEESLAYLSLLGLDHGRSAWRKVDTPELKVQLNSVTHPITRHHSLAAIKEGAPLWNTEQDQHKSSRIAYLDLVIPELLIVQAVHLLLEGFHRRIRELRQSIMLQPYSKGVSVKELESLRMHLSHFADIYAVASELATDSKGRRPAGVFLDAFESCRLYPDQNRISLNEVLKSAIEESAVRLQSGVQSTGDQITQFGSLLGAVENIRIQKGISRLTWLLVILTIVIIATPFLYPGSSSWFQSIAEELAKLWQR